MDYEIQNNFSPIYNTSIVLMKGRGYNEICDIIANSQISAINSEYDNLDGGTYYYTVNLGLPIKVYSTLSVEQIAEIERILGEALNEVKNDDNSYFHIKIAPILSRCDIDWELIGGMTAKTELKQKIETIRNIMISVATNGSLIKDEECRYKNLQTGIIKECKKLNLTYNNFYMSLWDWRGKWQADFPKYQERRDYINELFAQTLSYFDEAESPQNMETFVELNEWERIERTVAKIKQDSNTAKNEEDFQTIGLLCRDVIISLAQAVYDPLKHGNTDEKGMIIGHSDAVRMLTNYISFSLKGKHREEARAYAKAINDLANQLTHKRSATKKDMLLTMSATIALINFIGIIEDKY